MQQWNAKLWRQRSVPLRILQSGTFGVSPQPLVPCKWLSETPQTSLVSTCKSHQGPSVLFLAKGVKKTTWLCFPPCPKPLAAEAYRHGPTQAFRKNRPGSAAFRLKGMSSVFPRIADVTLPPSVSLPSFCSLPLCPFPPFPTSGKVPAKC